MENLKKNYIYRLLYEILTMLIPLVTTPYISRVLGAEGVGFYSYTFSYMTYFTMFAALGTSSYGMREISRCRDNKYEYSKKFWEIELLTIITSIICLFFWIIMIIVFFNSSLYFFALTPFLFATMFDISWFYTGQEKVSYSVSWNAVCKILGAIFIFLFVKEKNDLYIYFLINSFVLLIANISMWVFLPKFIQKISIKELQIKNHFKETLVYFVPTIATSIYTVLDKTLIGIITKNNLENGYYEQANKIISMAKAAVFVSINSIMEARISYLFINNKIDEIKDKIEKSFSYILLLGYATMFGLFAVAEDFVPIFFGIGYDQVIYLLYMMAPLIIIIGISNCLGSHYYTPAGFRAQSARYILIGSFINLICNISLIPFLGSKGAVIGTIVSELSISILYLKNCNGVLSVKQIYISSYKRIFAGIIMFLSILAIKKFLDLSIWSLIIEIFIGAMIYFFVLFMLKDSIIKEGISLLKSRIKKDNIKN